MKTYLDNLRPFERRVVVGVGVTLFLVLNFWFVFPHFSDWTTVQIRMREAQEKLTKYRAEIAQMQDYSAKVKKLQSEGSVVPAEDQALHFSTVIQSQASQSHVTITTSGRTTPRTNQNFVEYSVTINCQSGEQELVDFLYKLGEGNSMIRVRDLNVRPDPPRQQLMATVTLVASYQKKAPARPVATASRSSGGTPPAPADRSSPSPARANTTTK